MRDASIAWLRQSATRGTLLGHHGVNFEEAKGVLASGPLPESHDTKAAAMLALVEKQLNPGSPRPHHSGCSVVDEALNSGRLNSTQRANLERALKAYGSESCAAGDAGDNGVAIAVGNVSSGAVAETFSVKPYVLYDESTGDTRANILVTFKEGAKATAESFAHEGSHVADRQDLVAAFANASKGDPLADWLYMPENLTVRASESRAYRVSAAVSQGLGNSFSPGGYEVWNSGWREAD